MQTIETTGIVTPEHTVTLRLPDELAPGPHTFTLIVHSSPAVQPGPFADWPPRTNKFTNPLDTFRREDLYGDDGR